MTRLLTIDPGLNTGAMLGFYDDDAPYTMLKRYQIHGGVAGFVEWVMQGGAASADVLVVEKFNLAEENEFAANLTPVEIEGAIQAMQRLRLPGFPPFVSAWQGRQRKGDLIGYPKSVVKKAARQRYRFDFLKKFGLFAPGTENDDSNDAATHALVYLRHIGHEPTMDHYWPQTESVMLSNPSDLGPGF